MRAREPDRTGTVDRDGVRVAYEVHGNGDTTILLLPAWAISDSRLWKAQVPYLARHFRVVTYDPRGNGSSDRPTDPALYDPLEQMGDALAILDELEVAKAVLVGNSFGSIIGFLLAALHPDRVDGYVAIGTTLNLDGEPDTGVAGALAKFDQHLEESEGWAKYNRHYWEKDYPGFVDFFINAAFNEPHSTRMIEDGTTWAFNTSPEVLDATVASRVGVPPGKAAGKLRSLAPNIRCPALVIHGSEDLVAPIHRGRQLADLLDAPLEIIDGAGHCPQARHPARLNPMIRDFAAKVSGRSIPIPGPRRGTGPRVLFLSSPIGLGHARRDLAIANQLRSLAPDVDITWLAQNPVTRFLDAHNETTHPASKYLASESTHIEEKAGEHDLDIFGSFRNMDEILVANFGVFSDVVEEEGFDLVVGDEAWEVDHFLHEFPTSKRTRFAWLTDFVGFVPMPEGGEREAFLAADYNLEMIRHVERNPEVRDRSIFVGDPEDVVENTFGPGLPSIRDWVEAHYRFSGFITGFDPASLSDRTAIRAELGYRPDETIVLITVGGSGVGSSLLQRAMLAHIPLSESVPNLRTVVVAGPRVAPEQLPAIPGVELHAFLPDLHRHLAAADVAVVQGGLGTTMELTALGRPFIYVPLKNHFEQQVHVRHRLERHGAGRPIDYDRATPETLAEAVNEQLSFVPDYHPVPSDAAATAARQIAELL